MTIIHKKFEFEPYLADHAKRVERGLRHVLRTHTQGAPPKLREAMAYALFSGGKRIRPVLCLAACEAVGGRYQAAWFPALAVEILHAYTLVHDDLPCMDDDDFRRGKPTVHRKYGEAEAVLVGDALQALAFRLLCDVQKSEPVHHVAAALRVFGETTGANGVIGGQWEDVRFSKGIRRKITKTKVAYIHQHKTAHLLKCAAWLGAQYGGGTPRQAKALGAYAEHLGLAFQIVDDLLDEPERKVKPKAEREMSCLDVWTDTEARQEAERHTEMALKELRKTKGNTEPLRALVRYLLERRA